MKLNRLGLLPLAMLAAASIDRASAQIYSQNIVGYVNIPFLTGSNLFANPLVNDSDDINTIFESPYTPIPDGATISLWDATTKTFAIASVCSNAVWNPDLYLPPGTGALLITPADFTNTFVGYVLNHDGGLTGQLPAPLFSPPPVYTGPPGTFLLSDAAPMPDIGTDIFLNILGRRPRIGESVTLLSGTCTYLGHGQWDTLPVLELGGSAFLTVKPNAASRLTVTVPPPTLNLIVTNSQATVSWPGNSSGWILQTNTDPVNGTWGNYTGWVTNNVAVMDSSATNVFFRIMYPSE